LRKEKSGLYLREKEEKMPKVPLPRPMLQKQKTYMAKKEDAGITFERRWYVVDATDQPLGRLASKIAKILQGKHKPTYTPHFDVGDYVIVVNAAKVKLTGNKWEEKIYYRHSGYIGNLKEIPYKDLVAKHPDLPIKLAVKRMLPKNELGRRMLRKLKVYPGPDHPHQAQNPHPPHPLKRDGGHLKAGQKVAWGDLRGLRLGLASPLPFAVCLEVCEVVSLHWPKELHWALRREG